MDTNRQQRARGGPDPAGQRRASPVEEAKEAVSQGVDTLGSMVGDIIGDLQDIVRGEVQLAKTELKEEAGQMGKGAGMAGAGVFFGLIGFIFLMLSVTYILNQWVEMWIATGIVGLVLAVIAAILLSSGRKQIQEASLKPEKTFESVKEDTEWASRQMNSVRK